MKTTPAARARAKRWAQNNPERTRYMNYRSKMSKFLNEIATADDFDRIMTCVENYRERVGK